MFIFQKGFNYGQDGPGNRLVFHMQGCNLRCPWCSNPESMPVISKNTVEISDGEVIKECISALPVMYGGGGVTFTGGEPTLQYESLAYILKELKSLNIHTAIETNGTHKNLNGLLPYIDFLMLDFKHYDEKKLRRGTGAELSAVIKNIEHAKDYKANVLIRIPLVNGFNAALKDAKGFSDILQIFNFKVELLPYHEYGRTKWEKSGLTYNIQNGFVTNEVLQEFYNIFTFSGIETVKT